MLTVGISVLCGGGSVGFDPVPEETGKVAISPQAVSARIVTPIRETLKFNRIRICAKRDPYIAVAPSIAREAKVKLYVPRIRLCCPYDSEQTAFI